MTGSLLAMADDSQHDITRLLQDWRQGDRGALDQLVPLIGRDLRRIAKQRLGRAGHAEASLTTTSLVQEAYIRLLGGRSDPSFVFSALDLRVLSASAVCGDCRLRVTVRMPRGAEKWPVSRLLRTGSPSLSPIGVYVR